MSENLKAYSLGGSLVKCGFSSRGDSGPEIHKLPAPINGADAQSLTGRIRDFLQAGEVLNKDQSMKIGDTFPHPTIKGNPKCHVRGHVDGLLVVRWWRVTKQRWEYEVMYPDILKLLKSK